MGRFSVVYDYNDKAIIDLILYVKTISKIIKFCSLELILYEGFAEFHVLCMMIHLVTGSIDVMITCMILIYMLCSAFFS